MIIIMFSMFLVRLFRLGPSSCRENSFVIERATFVTYNISSSGLPISTSFFVSPCYMLLLLRQYRCAPVRYGRDSVIFGCQSK